MSPWWVNLENYISALSLTWYAFSWRSLIHSFFGQRKLHVLVKEKQSEGKKEQIWDGGIEEDWKSVDSRFSFSFSMDCLTRIDIIYFPYHYHPSTLISIALFFHFLLNLNMKLAFIKSLIALKNEFHFYSSQKISPHLMGFRLKTCESRFCTWRAYLHGSYTAENTWRTCEIPNITKNTIVAG